MFETAVVGCGGIGNAHAAAWSRICGAKLRFVVDTIPEKARTLAERYGCEALTNAAEIPQGIDCVSVATPPKGHYPVAKLLLDSGFNVFCEKPLTLSVDTGEELDALAKARGVKLGVGFKMRFEPIFRKAKELLPRIGTLVSVVTTKCQQFSDRPDGQWVKDSGAMYELSIHDFDLISYITGLDPEDVLFARLGHRWGWQAEDSFSIVARYPGGVIANLQGYYCTKTTFQYRDLAITFQGENGYMRVERPDRIVLHTDKFEIVEIPPDPVNTFDQELTHFMAYIRGEEENPIPASDAIRATRLIEAARAASGDPPLN